jgi:hypothetical protein
MSDGLIESAAKAKHDLGKYIAFQSRWLPDDAGVEDWTQALRSDLMETRRGPDGSEGAVEIWARLKPDFATLQGDPDIHQIDGAMLRIGAGLPYLESGGLDLSALHTMAEDARCVATHLAALHRRLKEG